MPTPVPVELDQPLAGSGLLAQSRPLPEGWQRGIKFLDTSCLLPVAMGECPTDDDLKPGQRAEAAQFRAFEVIQAVECSALDNHTDWDSIAGAELDRTRDDAIARELLTGQARWRDAGNNDPTVSLTSAAFLLTPGEDATLASALGCLETELLTANGGRGGVLYMPISVAYQAMVDGLLWRDGARWRTVTGSTVIVSAGFDGRVPASAGSSLPPEPGDPLVVYATTALWAGTGTRSVLHDVNRQINDVSARAEEVALVAFGPCSVFATATPVVACPASA